MKQIGIILAVVAMLVASASRSHALIISEDVTYWFKTANESGSVINPTSEWLKQNSAHLLIKVQQTVFDQEETMARLNRNDPSNPNEGTNNPGFLYAYSVTNLSVGNLFDLADKGITSFHVDWAMPSKHVTVSKNLALLEWSIDDTSPEAVAGPTWKWTPVDPGARPTLLPGDTLGGFWAVSNVGEDGICQASVLHIAALGSARIAGTTTGPCPEPGAYVSLLAGMGGFGLMARMRKKRPSR